MRSNFDRGSHCPQRVHCIISSIFYLLLFYLFTFKTACHPRDRAPRRRVAAVRIFGIGSEEEFLLFGTVEPAVVADGQRPVAVQLVGHVDGLHDAVTVVLRIKREVTDTLVAHGVVAHLIDDHLQQMQLRWRAWFTWRIVTIDEHQSVVGTVAELSRPRGIV